LKNLSRFFQAASRSAADPLSPLGREALRRMTGEFLHAARKLGEVTGEMHCALASAGAEDPAFAPEPITEDDVVRWTDDFARQVTNVLEHVGRRLDAIPGIFPQRSLNDLADIVREAPEYRALGGELELLRKGGLVKTRYHGDYHLGQVLRATGDAPNEWVILDFEGEPARPLSSRRVKHSPLRDVAGMLRSFDYALRMSMSEHETDNILVRASLQRWADAWMGEVRANFLSAYQEAAAGGSFAPSDAEHLRRLLTVFELEKAIYELGYEMNNRPDWIWIPVMGINNLTGGGA
jgi:maltose alpha-D-glucosyltransferase/alpha-amylase